MELEDRITRAVELFRSGYNCSQSVVAAFADLYGFTFEQALHMSASFGGGIGRMRMTCGTACGLFMLAGLEQCALKGEDRAAKSANYALVQRLAAEFKRRNGSLVRAWWRRPPASGWSTCAASFRRTGSDFTPAGIQRKRESIIFATF